MELLLFVLALVWVVFAIIQDFKTNEVANWLNFSLIIFTLAFRMFYSIFVSDYNVVLYGFLGLGIGFIVANFFYYARVFAGGDAKLLIALFVVIPISSNFYGNFLIFIGFLIFLLFFGAIYGLVYSFVISLKNWKSFRKDFLKKMNGSRVYFGISFFFALVFLVLGFVYGVYFILLSVLIFVFPYLYVYLKSVEKSCFIKEVDSKEISEGDWLVEPVKVGNKKIEGSWEGLSKDEVSILKEHKKKVLVKYGVPFTPAFLGALIGVWFFGDFLKQIFFNLV